MLFNFDIRSKIKSVIERLANYTENRLGSNARNIVYSYTPKTNRYNRTGALLGGRDAKVTSNQAVITVSPVFKGASKNYAPFVENGSKNIKARPYIKASFEDLKREANKILKI